MRADACGLSVPGRAAPWSPTTAASSSTARIVGWAIGLAGFLIGLYHWGLYDDRWCDRRVSSPMLDMVVGIAALVILIYLGLAA